MHTKIFLSIDAWHSIIPEKNDKMHHAIRESD